jgi:diguanylate cyclase (GGDEF)-like protein/PAS domain S-box-containing protein
MSVPSRQRLADDHQPPEPDSLAEAVLEGVSEGVILVGSDGKILHLNPAGQEILGYRADEAIGQEASLLLPLDLGPWLGGKAQGPNLLARTDFIKGQELTVSRKDGGSAPVVLSLAQPGGDDGPALVAILRDISDLRAAEAKIQSLTLSDPLTGLANRNLFHMKLEDAFNQAERRGRLVALMLLDLDGFKGINDNFGHAVGDALLREVAERLHRVTRKVDTLARLDGDGFAIILGDLKSAEVVEGTAQRLIDCISEPVTLDGCLLRTGASIGISFFPGDDTHQDELIRKADLALEEAKRSGSGSYHVYRSETNAKARANKALETDLRLALVREEFLLHFQPMIDIDCHDVVAAEALIRWQHPSRGLVPPVEFIPVAEASEVMVPLGEWVLRTACEQNKAWQTAGLPPFRIAVNISARQFQDGDFVAKVRNILRETNLDPHCLELEITEGMVMDDTVHVIEKFHEINKLGIEISIDDFGTGYSSLAYLKRFPVHRLKIDRSFVRDLSVDADDAAITEAVIRMGHSLNLKVLAEGVETERQIAFLRQKGCDELQGFLFGRPMAPDAFAAWIQAWAERKAG